MISNSLRRAMPAPINISFAILSAFLLVLAFPDYDLPILSWVAPVPLLLALHNEKDTAVGSGFLGWLFGTVFFYISCFWLTYAPINYGGFPAPAAYFLMIFAAVGAGFFSGLFGAAMAWFFRAFGDRAYFAAPAIWIGLELARYWITGNNWNAIGYSLAFGGRTIDLAAIGGVYLVGFVIILAAAIIAFSIRYLIPFNGLNSGIAASVVVICLMAVVIVELVLDRSGSQYPEDVQPAAIVSTIQANVPMSGLNLQKWRALRERHVMLAENELGKLESRSINGEEIPAVMVFPESPMNFQYGDDPEFQLFIHGFARKHNVDVLFNSAEFDNETQRYFNSAVMIGQGPGKLAQYDKIYLVPFGEFIPWPLESLVPALVGNFAKGRKYEVFPLGNAKAGVLICYESHFGEISRQSVLRGADVLIEMTNDGYLGPTPVLRQHMASAVFRAVETNRPLLRTTNVGVTAYITVKGEIRDVAPIYAEDSRTWKVYRSDGEHTFYAKYGDWFGWLCLVIGAVLLGYAMRKPAHEQGRN